MFILSEVLFSNNFIFFKRRYSRIEIEKVFYDIIVFLKYF